jgi:hypothetical protein
MHFCKHQKSHGRTGEKNRLPRTVTYRKNSEKPPATGLRRSNTQIIDKNYTTEKKKLRRSRLQTFEHTALPTC